MTQISELVSAREDWLDELPNFQRKILNQLAENSDLEAAAQSWLEALPGSQTAVFGGTGGAKIFFEKVLDELHDLLCSSDRYAEERASLLKEYRAGQTSFVAGVTSVVSPVVGASPSVLTPVVAVILTIVSQASLRAWCSMQTDRRAKRESDGQTS